MALGGLNKIQGFAPQRGLLQPTQPPGTPRLLFEGGFSTVKASSTNLHLEFVVHPVKGLTRVNACIGELETGGANVTAIIPRGKELRLRC